MVKIENPLVPFIVFFALVILLTIVVTNSRSVPAQLPAPAVRPKAGLTLGQVKESALDLRQKPSSKERDFSSLERPDLRKMLFDAVRDYEEGDVKGAEDKLRTVVVFDQSNVRALSSLVAMLSGEGRFKEAESFAKLLAKADPYNASFLSRLAAVLSSQGKYEEAAACVEKAVELAPDSGESYVTLAGLYALAGKRQEALEEFRTAYAKLGERVLAFCDDPALDSIKEDRQFKDIIEQAASDMAESSAMASMRRDLSSPAQPPPEPPQQ